MRILVFFGTRPETIKMAPVIHALAHEPGLTVRVCVTAQHRHMLDQALDIFRIRPNCDLDLMRRDQRLPDLTARLLTAASETISTEKPDLVIVHGDTTTTFACALAAFYAKVPVGHVEAGLRTGNMDAPWPEEFNRRGVDLFARFLWAPTEGAARALRAERSDHEAIVITGNTVIDALRFMAARLDEPDFYRTQIGDFFNFVRQDKRLILVTTHRRESFDGGIAATCDAIAALADRSDVQILWPVHPNPAVKRVVEARFTGSETVRLCPPVNYAVLVEALRRSHFIITDSGGLQEEAPDFGKPVLVTRTATERPEAVEANKARLVGQNSANILSAAQTLLDDPDAYETMSAGSNPYGDGRAAERIVASILAARDRICA